MKDEAVFHFAKREREREREREDLGLKNTKSAVSNNINRVRLSNYFVRPNQHGNARSRLISEAKQGWAWLVLGWETA